MRTSTPMYVLGVTTFILVVAGCSGYAPMESSTASVRHAAWSARTVAAFGGARDLAETEAQTLSAAEAPAVDAARLERLVVYNAVLNLVVPNVEESLLRVREIIGELDGHLQQMTSRSITFKVPAARFHDGIDAVEKLGEVTSRDVKGTDVTEEMRDLRIRLDNAQQSRERLVKLLEMAEKVEDALKIEKELERLTETIELLKGKIRYLEHSVVFSTITVVLNSPLPQEEIAMEVPFPWVHTLAADLVSGTAGPRGWQLLWWRRVKFDLPQGYVKYYERNYLTRAMSGNGVYLRVKRHGNREKAETEFWAPLVRRMLLAGQAMAIREEKTLKLAEGTDAYMLLCSRQFGRKHYGYLIAVAARGRRVCVLEAWGPLEQMNQDKAKLEASVRSIRW